MNFIIFTTDTVIIIIIIIIIINGVRKLNDVFMSNHNFIILYASMPQRLSFSVVLRFDQSLRYIFHCQSNNAVIIIMLLQVQDEYASSCEETVIEEDRADYVAE